MCMGCDLSAIYAGPIIHPHGYDDPPCHNDTSYNMGVARPGSSVLSDPPCHPSLGSHPVRPSIISKNTWVILEVRHFRQSYSRDFCAKTVVVFLTKYRHPMSTTTYKTTS
jgi:hypothetical protein